MRVKDTPCIGAACIAGVGAGMFDGYQQAVERMGGSDPYAPAPPALVEHYSRKYRRYLENQDILGAIFARG